LIRDSHKTSAPAGGPFPVFGEGMRRGDPRRG
jgi:hypothetical protein